MRPSKDLPDRELMLIFLQEASTTSLRDDTLMEIRDRVYEDSPRGYKWFYTLTRNRVMPPHTEPWMDKLYESKYKRLVNEAFRGSTKTTIFTESFTAYQIGIHPERSNLLVQASPDTIEEAMSNVGDIISKNPMFRLLFPHVVPDEDKGWGERRGRWVKSDFVDYGEWTRLRHKNPTILGGTYKSSTIVGKHPTGVFIMDDINDRKNTESERLNREVNENVTDVFFPMLEDSAYNIFNQTPWTKRDALQLVKDTGVWDWSFTPVLTPRPEGEGEYIEVRTPEGNVPYATWCDLAWPERFDEEMITVKYLEQGYRGFARMYLLDLTAIEGMLLRREWLHDYLMPLNDEWVTYMGVDYASGDGEDYFAIAVVQESPDGKMILRDGFRGQLSRTEAEKKLHAMVGLYENVLAIGIETDGSGKDFYDTLVRYGNLPVVPMKTGGRNKTYRFVDVMAPHFEFAKVLLTEDKTPFHNTFIEEWVSYDGSQQTHDDTLDATYYALSAAGKLYEAAMPDFTQNTVESYRERRRKQKAISPWARISNG